MIPSDSEMKFMEDELITFPSIKNYSRDMEVNGIINRERHEQEHIGLYILY